MVGGSDCAAFFVFGAFFEASLRLGSGARKARRASSSTESRSLWVPVSAVALDRRGSATNGAEPEGGSLEADPVPASDPLETGSDFAASIKARRLCFLGFGGAGDRGGDGADAREPVIEEGTSAVLFFVNGARDAGCVAADDTADFLRLFFDCGLNVGDSVRVDFAAGSHEAATGREDADV